MLSALKNFGITFLIALLIFGVIAFFATRMITGTIRDILTDERTELDNIINNETKESDTTTDTDPEGPGDTDEIYGNSFNMLFITSDYRPERFYDYKPSMSAMYSMDWASMDPVSLMGYLSRDYRDWRASSIVFVRVDKERQEIIYSYISPKIRVSTEYGYRSLGEALSLFGMEKISQYVYSITGCSIDYTFLINGYNLDEFVQLTNTVGIDLPLTIYNDGMYNTFRSQREVEETDENGNKRTVQKANQYLLSNGYVTLTGETIYNVLSAREDSSSELSEKQGYAISAASRYYENIASLDEYTMKCTLIQLLTTSNRWYDMENMAANITNPRGNTQYGDYFVIYPVVGSANEGLTEPYDSIVESDFLIENFYEVYDLVKASLNFEKKVIICPCSYHPKAETVESFFDYQSSKGTQLYSKYRKTAVN